VPNGLPCVISCTMCDMRSRSVIYIFTYFLR
jgi:hypothetical protein